MNSNTKLMSSNKQFDELLKNLVDIYSKEEIESIRSAYMQAKALSKLEAKLIRPIVPIREWVNNPYYVGNSVNTLYDYWKNALIEVFDSETPINQLILTGAQGVGKTTFAVLVIIRKIYELSCYENIARLFNLDAISRIAFAYLSITKDQAMNSGFAKLTEWLDDIPYFRDNFKRKPGIDSALIWPEERMFVTVGSTRSHFIGLDMIGAILDEANFREQAATKDNDYNVNKKVLELYSQLITRSQTRFIVGGKNHSLTILVSSSTHVGSFTEEVIQKHRHSKNTKIYSPALWDVKPEAYCGERFLVFAGGNNLEPFIISTFEDLNIVLHAFGKQLLTPETLGSARAPIDLYDTLPTEVQQVVLTIPIEHYDVFTLNIIEGLQSLAGYSVASLSKFFRNYAAYTAAVKEELRHPFIRQDIPLSNTSNSFEEGYMPLNFYLDPEYHFANPHAPRFMHLDLSLSGDATGIAMAHISGHKPIYQKQKTEDQIKYGDPDQFEATIPVITVDFMLRIKPPKKPNRISLPKIRDFIIYLQQVHRLNIVLVTADQFQSAQMLQELSDFGIKTANLSVDRTSEPYFTLASLFDEGRINIYNYEFFKDQLFGLIYFAGAKKIDHPKDGAKDVSDAVAGAVYNAIKSQEKNSSSDFDLLKAFVEINKNNGPDINDPVQRAIDNLVNMLKGS